MCVSRRVTHDVGLCGFALALPRRSSKSREVNIEVKAFPVCYIDGVPSDSVTVEITSVRRPGRVPPRLVPPCSTETLSFTICLRSGFYYGVLNKRQSAPLGLLFGRCVFHGVYVSQTLILIVARGLDLRTWPCVGYSPVPVLTMVPVRNITRM